MRQSLVAQFIQLQQGRFYDVRPGVAVEENWLLHIEQSRVDTLEILVHLPDLLAVPFRRNHFTCGRKAVMDDTGNRPPSSHHDLLLDEVLDSECVVKFDRGSNTGLKVVKYRRGSISHHRSQFEQEQVVIVARKKQRRHLKTVSF